MKQVQPGDMAIIINTHQLDNAGLIGGVCRVLDWVYHGDVVRGYPMRLKKSQGPFVTTDAIGDYYGVGVFSVKNLLPITPDDSITQEQDEEVAA